ncbi:hypothetical protein N2599_29815 (plasmid) [Rhizobium sullae]|uniref:Uncharacterized protein n=1 Tax=Rhizobium sullae TaxID=50338 RepID=A0ABY5XSZ9_RHISU|nr:hypothetical protein [Rhizobium sullae]UWU17003.1 hypothetical protein N2599_29815 [Rhizobium sullae]
MSQLKNGHPHFALMGFWGKISLGKGWEDPVNFQQRAILKAALVDIENLAAPRHIDEVSAALGMDMVQFAKLGADGMKQAIYSALLLGSNAATSTSIKDQQRWREAAQIKLPASPTRN